MMLLKILPSILILLLLYSCDKGLAPEGEKPDSFLSGVVEFKGGIDAWISPDSAAALRVAAFYKFPSENVINEVLAGNAIFNFLSYPMFVDSINFELKIDRAPAELEYIAVVLQTHPDSLFNQKLIGIYSADFSLNHSPVFVGLGDRKEIKIIVDWQNLPPQPF